VKNSKRIVIIGATSAIAEHCARLWVQGKSVDLTLVGRDATRTERVAADLRVRSPQSDIRVLQAEFLDSVAIQQTVHAIVEQGPIDIVLIAHGSLPDQNICQTDLTACREALEVNGISPVLYAEAFAKPMFQTNRGTLALIGSVAGDRGRKSNYVYGAAKGLVTRIVPDPEVASEARATAQRICESSPLALRSHKQQIRRLTVDTSPVTSEERMGVYAFADSEDYQLGYRAFLSKQKANFVGR